MTYRELYESATRKLEKSEITLGEYEEMTKPLNEDVRTWISVSERLPKDLDPVNITWINHNPESYYAEDSLTERNCIKCAGEHRQLAEWLKDYKRLLEQEPCEMTAEEYRQRMIQAFHNTDTDELIAVCVLPTEKEFEHLEWLLKNHYKKDPCEDAISRQAVLEKAVYTETEEGWCGYTVDVDYIKSLPSVNPQEPKTGHWILQPSNKEQNERDFIWWKCSECGQVIFSESEHDRKEFHAFCGRCGAKMIEPKERSDKE